MTPNDKLIVSLLEEQAALRTLLFRARELVDEAITTHIYDFANGDKIEPGCGYTQLVADIDALPK